MLKKQTFSGVVKRCGTRLRKDRFLLTVQFREIRFGICPENPR